MCPVALIGFRKRLTICWSGARPGRSFTFSAQRLAGRRSGSRRSSSPSASSILHHGRSAADLVQIFHHELAARLEIGEQRSSFADFLEIVDREGNADRARHRDQVQHGIGRAAKSR